VTEASARDRTPDGENRGESAEIAATGQLARLAEQLESPARCVPTVLRVTPIGIAASAQHDSGALLTTAVPLNLVGAKRSAAAAAAGQGRVLDSTVIDLEIAGE
jgi:hypothetical protein